MNKGEIYLVEIPSTNGHEQVGIRPAIVVATTPANVTLIIPFTTNIEALRCPFTQEVRPSKRNGLSTLSIALVFQLRAIDTKRLKTKIGDVEESFMKDLNGMLLKLLQL